TLPTTVKSVASTSLVYTRHILPKFKRTLFLCARSEVWSERRAVEPSAVRLHWRSGVVDKRVRRSSRRLLTIEYPVAERRVGVSAISNIKGQLPRPRRRKRIGVYPKSPPPCPNIVSLPSNVIPPRPPCPPGTMTSRDPCRAISVPPADAIPL